MNSTTSLPSFEAAAQALELLQALGTPAETHGLLCALFSSGAIVRQEAWLSSLITTHFESDDSKAKAAQQVLANLYLATEQGFHSEQFEIKLLLPGDEVDLESRVEALAEWCQGFISGLNLIGVPVENHPDPEVAEALQDLMEISCVSYVEEQGEDDEAEKNYAELVEHTRLAVVLVYGELRSAETQKAGAQSSKTLH
ncbi:MAG: putative conserved exported protein precursor [Gammaproteobacteria bacterium]|jgi:yecA family protein|nr:putative conserved exported protein precursor [Gammaproteobacteria bacterium]